MSDKKVINLKSSSQEAPAKSESVSQLVSKEGCAQGQYSSLFQNDLRNVVAPGLYESLREAIPMLDGAIQTYKMIDGTPMIVGDNDEAVAALAKFAREVQVNDNQVGLAAYANANRDEIHEQGFGISEHLVDSTGVFRLNVADSKAVHFARKEDGTLGWYFNPCEESQYAYKSSTSETVAQILRHRTPVNIAASAFGDKGFVELDRDRTHYLAFRTENSDAYGVSILRSLPFFAEELLTIFNSIKNTWERFGDPSYLLNYKVGTKLSNQPDENGDTPLEARRKALAADLAIAVQNKRAGNSSDFVVAVDKDSEVTLTIIGADGQVLEAEVPIKKTVEQLTSGLNLPGWMLGIEGSSVQGQAKFETELVRQASSYRTDREEILLDDICAVHLRALGISWDDTLEEIEDPAAPGGVRMVRAAWRVVYHKPNLSDLEGIAKANFMNTQSDTLRDRVTNENVNIPIASEEDENGIPKNIVRRKQPVNTKKKPEGHHHHSVTALEKRPIENEPLDRVESAGIRKTHAAWDITINQILVSLGLINETGATNIIPSNGMQADGFTLTTADKEMIAAELASFVLAIHENELVAQGAMAEAYTRSWAQGVIDGYTRSGLSAAVGPLTNEAQVAETLASSRKHFTDFIENTVTPEMTRILEAGAAAGESSANIAANLGKNMKDATWKWDQIARSEGAMAWDGAKRGEWGAEITDGAIEDQFDWLEAPDACPICRALTPGNPYTLETLPRVVIDTHPSDRCDTAPHIAEST